MAFAFIIPLKIILNQIFGIYRIISKYASFEDFLRITLVVAGTNILLVLSIFLFKLNLMSESAFIIITLIEITGMMVPRLIRRTTSLIGYRLRLKVSQEPGIRTLIIGAGSAGEMVVKEISKNQTLSNILIGFIDDDTEKIGRQIMGVSILGTLDNIEDIVARYDIKEVIIAIKSIPKHKFHDLVNRLIGLQVKVKKVKFN